MEQRIRRMERALGVNRHDRTVWVWVLPPGIGGITAILFGYVAGLPTFVGDMPLALRVAAAVFGFITMTTLSGMVLAWFGDSEDQD